MRTAVGRALALGSLIAAVALIALLMFDEGGDYVVKARFENAGQVVNGGLVEIAGKQVGTVTDQRLTEDGLAELTLRIDEGWAPIPRGTHAQIRQFGLSGPASRYVDLQYPHGKPRGDLPDGAVLGLDRTTAHVDLDEIFAIFDKRTRRALSGVFRVMTHPERGCQVLEPLDAFYPELCDGVIAHHERWDGTGYPRGLRGEAIPRTARIVSIADAFDATTASRPYNDPISVNEAIEKIRAGRATQFDPDLVDLFLSPPVLLDIRKARLGCETLLRPRGAGRRREKAAATPDVTFRWRTAPRAQRLPDPARRKSS